MADKKGVNSYDPTPGTVRVGTIVGYDADANQLQIQLTETSAIKGSNPQPQSIPITYPLISNNGLFIGSLPTKNTPVTVAQGNGGQFYFLNYAPENTTLIPESLVEDQLLIYSTDTSAITLDTDSNITIGSDSHNIHIFAGSQQYPKTNLITFTLENENHFTQSYREIGGIIKRDTRPNPQAASYSGDTKLEDDSYDNIFGVVGMDPTTTANNILSGPTKNPPLVEHRKIVYEYQYKSNVDSFTTESAKYLANAQAATLYSTPNRRASRADTMSLSLVAPNFLIEAVEGTVVDIFGNPLDLNRQPIPIGATASTTLRSNGSTTNNIQTSYQNIQTLQRRGLAYHFEVNARKDPSPLNQGTALTINDDNYNAKLQRSRFSFDVDKEGQFKLNVPASSEYGNVPMLLRAENYSTFATTDGGNPNQLWFLQSAQGVSQDIFVDSFAAPMKTPSTSASGFDVSFAHGSIKVQDNSSQSNLGPLDRISLFPGGNVGDASASYNIQHGTAYHDILQTCSMHQHTAEVLGYPIGQVLSPNITVVDIVGETQTMDTTSIKSGLKSGSNFSPPPVITITDLYDVASDTINIGTVGATATPGATAPATNGNAGGRSGAVNLDGSLELNIGANTVDRQSLWLDTAGGIVANIGRDIKQRSLVMGMDGDALIQIGGFGVSGDARFAALGQDGQYNGTLDIRVFNNGFAHLIRVDSTGITIMSPGNISMHAGQNMILSADGQIIMDCEGLVHQNRKVKKVFGGSI